MTAPIDLVGKKAIYRGGLIYEYKGFSQPLFGLKVDVIYLSPCGFFTIEYAPPRAVERKGKSSSSYPAQTYCWVERSSLTLPGEESKRKGAVEMTTEHTF